MLVDIYALCFAKVPQSCHIISAGNHEPAENLRPILQNPPGATQGFQKTHKSGGARSRRESASGNLYKKCDNQSQSVLFYALIGLESNHRLTLSLYHGFCCGNRHFGYSLKPKIHFMLIFDRKTILPSR